MFVSKCQHCKVRIYKGWFCETCWLDLGSARQHMLFLCWDQSNCSGMWAYFRDELRRAVVFLESQKTGA